MPMVCSPRHGLGCGQDILYTVGIVCNVRGLTNIGDLGHRSLPSIREL